MQRTIRKGVLLAGALATILSTTMGAQQRSSSKLHIGSTDVAVLANFEHARVAEENGNSFWFKGGSVDGSVSFYKGLGLAANFTGEHADSVQNGVGVSKIAYMFGPRYTMDVTGKMHHPARIFGEWLFGGAHAFDSTFPGANGVQSSANAFSMQAGGGIDVSVKKGFGIRALELDYVHTNLPNNASNSQNDLRIGFGVSWRK